MSKSVKRRLNRLANSSTHCSLRPAGVSTSTRDAAPRAFNSATMSAAWTVFPSVIGDQDSGAATVHDGQRRLELVRHQVHAGSASGLKYARRSRLGDQLTTGSTPPGCANDPEASGCAEWFNQVERRQDLLLMAEVGRTETR